MHGENDDLKVGARGEGIRQTGLIDSARRPVRPYCGRYLMLKQIADQCMSLYETGTPTEAEENSNGQSS